MPVDDAKTVFRKPISRSKVAEIAKSVAKAKEKANKAQAEPVKSDDNIDATVFVAKTAIEPQETTSNSDADKTVFAARTPIKSVAEPDDATRFNPSSLVQNTNGTNMSSSNSGSALDLIDSATEYDPNKRVNVSDTPVTETTDNSKLLKGRFVLEDILGIGGMGVVYKAKDLLKVEAQDRDPYVAIKVLSEEFRTHPEAFISLQREAKKAQHIANQNTVKVYDFDRDGEVVFMTMEYMVGQPLDQMVKQYNATGLPRNDAWNILKGMCLALIHAHREDIVHSDLKPVTCLLPIMVPQKSLILVSHVRYKK
jgi:serine/threonine protein kinase